MAKEVKEAAELLLSLARQMGFIGEKFTGSSLDVSILGKLVLGNRQVQSSQLVCPQLPAIRQQLPRDPNRHLFQRLRHPSRPLPLLRARLRRSCPKGKGHDAGIASQ